MSADIREGLMEAQNSDERLMRFPRLSRNHIDAVLAYIRERDAWRPIETAPKGLVLVYRAKMKSNDRIAIRNVRDWCGPTCCPRAEPTHWQPLPAPPKEQPK